VKLKNVPTISPALQPGSSNMPRNAKFILQTARISFFSNLKTIVFVRIDYLSVTGNSAHARLILLSTKNTSYNDLANKSLQGTGQCLSETLCCISIGNH
jgi:hypothetical protein